MKNAELCQQKFAPYSEIFRACYYFFLARAARFLEALLLMALR